MEEAKRPGADRFAVALICVLWALAIVAVDPRGDFPVTDDWAFIDSVRAMTERGELRLSDWGAMNLVSQILWGSLFGAAFGVDYDVLRASTLVALLIAGLSFYALARTARLDPRMAALAAVVVMFNPLTFSLAFSFMTDVPYLAMQMLAMALIAGGYRARSRLRAALGWGFGLAALLCRQIGIAIAAGATGEALLRSRRSPRRIALALLPLAGFAAVQAAYQNWLVSSGTAPRLYGLQTKGLFERFSADPVFIAQEAGWAILWGFFYLGLMTLPLTLVLAPGLRARISERRRLPVLAALTAILVVIVGLTVYFRLLFPMWLNTIRVEGLGADLGATTYQAELVSPSMPGWVRLLLTYVAGAGGALLLAALGVCLLDRLRERGGERFDVRAFAVIVALTLFAPILLLELRFDRYFIPIIPCLLVAMAPPASAYRPSRAVFAAGCVAAAALAGYSVAATHDFMQVKRMQWRAYSDLALSVRPERIDGTWVLNGQASFGRFGNARHGDPSDVFGWYERADYMVGTQPPRPGYSTIAIYPVERWLTWGKPGRPILVQRHVAASDTAGAVERSTGR